MSERYKDNQRFDVMFDRGPVMPLLKKLFRRSLVPFVLFGVQIGGMDAQVFSHAR